MGFSTEREVYDLYVTVYQRKDDKVFMPSYSMNEHQHSTSLGRVKAEGHKVVYDKRVRFEVSDRRVALAEEITGLVGRATEFSEDKLVEIIEGFVPASHIQ